jgi:hypothetical protein
MKKLNEIITSCFICILCLYILYMPAFSIGNIHNDPLNHVNQEWVNKDASNAGSFYFSNTTAPSGSHVAQMMGGRRYKNKIYRKYKMSRYSRKRTKHGRVSRKKRYSRRPRHSRRRSRRMRGGTQTNVYGIGGPLNNTMSALANPAPYYKL